MAEKPTYAELEETVKKLENEAAKRKMAEKALDRQRRELISIFDGINEPIYICDPDTPKGKQQDESEAIQQSRFWWFPDNGP